VTNEKKNCLVTGGAGFIGSHVCERLIQDGHHVIALDNLASGRVANFKDFDHNPRFQFFKADIRAPGQINEAFHGIDWVFHLAGLADIVPSIEKPDDYFSTNVTGTFNVLQAARAANVKRLVYAASSSSYGIPDAYPTPETSPIRPQYPYALTKYMGEELVLHWAHTYQMPTVSLRLFNVYGPRSRTTGAYGAVFGVFLAQKINRKPYTVVGDGTQSRDFTFVTDVAEAFVRAAESSVSGEALNVGSGHHYSVNRLVELLEGPVTHIPKRPGEPDCTFADVSKIKALLDWQARVPLEAGVAEMLIRIHDWADAPVWEPSSIETATSTWFRYLAR
jgi:UDP-glucose 4-epimerase